MDRLVPMRWPAEWDDPARLELLRGTPVNCLVLEQSAPAALREHARAAGLSVAGSEIQWAGRAQMDWRRSSAVFAITDGVWPGVPAGRNDAAEAGPTGMPWVDSNGWLVQLARVRSGGRPIWIATEPPAGAPARAADYRLAIADAAAYGGRWVVTLDSQLRAGLTGAESSAIATWKSIVSALAFFEAHRDWDNYEPLGAVAVVSDFSGANADFSGEVLNLLARRAVPYRVVEKGRALPGVAAVIYADAEPPAPPLGAKLAAFVQSGGLLVAGSKFPAPPGEPATGDPYHRWNVRRLGKGRIALARDEPMDPYLVAQDVQLLLGHRHDLLRFFNSGTLNSFYTAKERRALLQVINYAGREASHAVSVAFHQQYQRARVRTLDAPESQPLEPSPELHLPPFATYAAVELEE